MLDKANNLHPNIKFVRQIGRSLSFLDVLMENKCGTLHTSVYHKEAAGPYTVPFKSDHPRHVFKNIIENALTRAVRYSSTLYAFNRERRTITLMLLYNGYPPRYIYTRLEQFFRHYIPTTAPMILDMFENEKQFLETRYQVLHQRVQIKKPKQTPLITTINDTNNKEEHDDTIAQLSSTKETKWKRNLISHFQYEQRIKSCQKEIHHIWAKRFNEKQMANTRLIIGTRNNRNGSKEMITKHPSTASLRLMKTQKQPDT